MSHFELTREEIQKLSDLNTFDAKVLNKRFKELFDTMHNIEKNVRKTYKIERADGTVVEFANSYLDIVSENLKNLIMYSQDLREFIYRKIAATQPNETSTGTDANVESSITEVEEVMEDDEALQNECAS